MRGFREVRNPERRIEDPTRRALKNLPDEIGIDDLNGFKSIKPENGMTFEEAQNFWDNFWENLPDQIGE